MCAIVWIYLSVEISMFTCDEYVGYELYVDGKCMCCDAMSILYC